MTSEFERELRDIRDSQEKLELNELLARFDGVERRRLEGVLAQECRIEIIGKLEDIIPPLLSDIANATWTENFPSQDTRGVLSPGGHSPDYFSASHPSYAKKLIEEMDTGRDEVLWSVDNDGWVYSLKLFFTSGSEADGEFVYHNRVVPHLTFTFGEAEVEELQKMVRDEGRGDIKTLTPFGAMGVWGLGKLMPKNPFSDEQLRAAFRIAASFGPYHKPTIERKEREYEERRQAGIRGDSPGPIR